MEYAELQELTNKERISVRITLGKDYKLDYWRGENEGNS
jgi:hypothetical protein